MSAPVLGQGGPAVQGCLLEIGFVLLHEDSPGLGGRVAANQQRLELDRQRVIANVCRSAGYRQQLLFSRYQANMGACNKRIRGVFWALNQRFLRFQSSRECGLELSVGCGKGQHGCQSVGVAAIPCALVFLGVCWPVGHPFGHERVGLYQQHVFHETCRAVPLACPNTARCFHTYAP